MKTQKKYSFDSLYAVGEQLPRKFSVSFKEVVDKDQVKVQVLLNGEKQLGDVITDNAYTNDFYRYHDIFHYTFATMLEWSPCTRSMLRVKRKSNPIVDEVEDGARATITEEAISLLLFNEAKRKHFLSNQKISKTLLKIIKGMTDSFEVKVKSEQEWEKAISKGYEMFRQLIKHKGGKVDFDMSEKAVRFSVL